MIALIVAISEDRVIGVDGGIPWKYPGDLKRFKAVTMGHPVVMGRKTWESLGGKPLAGRRNVVVSRTLREAPGAEVFPDVRRALAAAGDADEVWVIGGGEIYRETLPLADLVDVTLVPETIGRADAVRFPELDPAEWQEGPVLPHEENPALRRQVFTRRRA